MKAYSPLKSLRSSCRTRHGKPHNYLKQIEMICAKVREYRHAENPKYKDKPSGA